MRAAYFVLFLLGFSAFFLLQRTAADATRSAHSVAETHKPPLYLEVLATLRGTARGPFVPDVRLHPGAQISLQARTSAAARVYMLHCDAQAALSIFPDAGGIDFRADQWVPLPAAGMPLRLGAQHGNETVYVVATRDALDRADSRLSQWLLEARDGARCGAALDALLAGHEAASAPPTAATPPAKKLPFAVRGVDVSKSAVARAFAERDGVVVLRFAYVNAP
jgi:hypothetical protein